MRGLVFAVVVAATVMLSALVGSASATMPAQWKNCTAVNKKYPHGVGRANAVDKVSGSTEPVTTFKRSNKLYKTAISYNKGLERDKDGIACEKL